MGRSLALDCGTLPFPTMISNKTYLRGVVNMYDKFLCTYSTILQSPVTALISPPSSTQVHTRFTCLRSAFFRTMQGHIFHPVRAGHTPLAVSMHQQASSYLGQSAILNICESGTNSELARARSSFDISVTCHTDSHTSESLAVEPIEMVTVLLLLRDSKSRTCNKR